MSVEQRPHEALQSAISQNPQAAEALDGLVKRELDTRIVQTTHALDERNRYSRIEGVLSGVLLTAGLALGIAAITTMTPMVALTGIAGGVAGTFGMLLGLAALGARSDAQQLQNELNELRAARQVAEDPQKVAAIADSKLQEQAVGKSQWQQKIAMAEKNDCQCHTLH